MSSLQSHSPFCIPIVIKIGSVPIVDVLKSLSTSLEQSGSTEQLSVHIIGVDPRVASLEAIGIRAVLKLLWTDLHRMQDLRVHAHWRSSLEEVTNLFYPGSLGLEMLYNVDDIGA